MARGSSTATIPKFDKEGIIALQIHVWKEPMEVRFKDIEIKELTP